MKKFLLIFVILGLVFCLLGCDNNTGNNNPDPGPDDTQTPTACETNDEFADYIIQIYKDIAANDSLYKSIVGDVSAPKVTADEVLENTDSWREVIKNSLSNPEVVIDVEINEGKRTYTFNAEKILNINGVGTHMGAGFPSYATVDWTTTQAKFVCQIGQ